MYNYKYLLLRRLQKHIKHGGLVAYPTEFCYGIGCDSNNYRAIHKILTIKKRCTHKGMIVTTNHIDKLSNITQKLTIAQQNDVSHYWPGSYSIIIPPKNDKPATRLLYGSHHGIAVRISSYPVLRQLCRAMPVPLVATSLNHSGYRVNKTYQTACRLWKHVKSLAILPGVIAWAKKPSTVIDIWQNRCYRE